MNVTETATWIRWIIIELGHVDVCLKCSMLSSNLTLPGEGHLFQLFQVFVCLKRCHDAEMVCAGPQTSLDVCWGRKSSPKHAKSLVDKGS
jgi:hypothetical protein